MKPTLKIQFLSLCVLLALLSMGTQSGFAQADPPLSFANNYFLRGDFTVAGAQGMLSNFTTINGNSYAVGTITVPDTNPGIKPSVITGNGSNAVPANAEVIAALLYWQTVEKVGVMPGQPGSGENGFFRPVITGGPAAPGYAISGVSLSSGTNTVSWSSGGCTSGSTGKIIRSYRANVLGALPRDATGNISPNVKYEVRLPGTSSTTPIAVGASLVLIYRILDPNIPLNSIVIYDGDYAPSNTSLIMTQTMQGFYEAAKNAVSRLAHIVGNGKTNKFETVYLNNKALPSFYPKGEPPFPGYYGSWDNTVWTFDPDQTYVNLPNPVAEESASVTTQVVPSSNMQGCVSWGASIISTTVKNTDGDGLLDVWKLPKAPNNPRRPGYCDAAVLEGQCTQGDANWVDLPGAAPGQKDVFIQLDYMCSQVNANGSCTTGDGTNYSFDPSLHNDPNDHNYNAVQKVVNAYFNHGITLHVNPPSANQSNFHAIPEPYCQDDTTTSPPSLCPFPNSPGTSANLGVVTWPGGFDFLKSQLIDSNDPTNLTDCATSTPPAYCIPRFQPAAAPSKHYLLLGHAVGVSEWALVGGTLTNVTQSGNTVTQPGYMVTFTTSSPVGVLDSIGTDANGNNIPDPACPNGRVTVIGASTNPDLNGTFCISSPTNPQGNTFSILIGGGAMKASYKLATDPNLAVAPGFTGTASGVSDVGGANSYISLGLWGNPAFSGQNAQTSPASDGQKASVIAGTIMHELGHGNGLAHGGPAAYVAQNQQSLQSVTTNCKPNYMSAMSYSRQVDFAPDYSGTILHDLNESSATGNLNIVDTTSWYVAWPLKDSSGHTIVDTNGNPIGSPAKAFCSGLPLPLSAPPSMMRVTGPANTFSFSNVANPDINFDDLLEDLLGADDWHNLDLAQLDATGADTNSSGQRFNGGGQRFNGGGQRFNGGGQRFNGGGQRFNGGGQRFNGGGEIDTATVNSITRPPQNLRITAEEASPRYVDLQWDAPTFGSIGAYRVYRSPDGGSTFTLIATVPGTQLTYQDNNGPGAGPACLTSPGKYEYFVTAVLAGTFAGPLPQPTEGQESVPSNTVAGEPNSTAQVTGCYTLAGISATPASATHGTIVSITWQVKDDFYVTDNPVNNLSAGTLVALGPSGASCTQGSTTLVSNGAAQAQNGASNFMVTAGLFSLTWDTDMACAGSYTLKLTLDSGQTESIPVQLLIDVTDRDNPHVNTTSLPDAHLGSAYNYTLSEDGGVGAIKWTFSGTLPPGIVLDQNSGTLSGTPTTAGTYTFTVTATDSASSPNSGTQMLTLFVNGCTTTPSGLVSWYPLNGNALDIRGGKPGTLVGSGGQFVSAEVGQGFKSGGEGSVITVPAAAYLNPLNFTVGAWVSVDAISGDPTMLIVWQGDNTGTDVSTPYALGVQGTPTFVPSQNATIVGTSGPGKVFAMFSDGTHELDVFSNTVLTPGVFYYVTLTWNGPSVGASLYVNGVLENSSGQTPFVGLASPINPFQIGGILSGTTDSFNGVIDELQIWGTPLTGAQISAIYNAGSYGQCTTLWFSEETANKVGRINADGTGVSGFPLATAANANPYGISAGPDGNMWTTEYGTGKIATITPGGAITEYPTLANSSGPNGITSGPDGNFWFAEHDVNKIGRVTTTGSVNEFPTSGTNPYAIAAGPDGNLWFTEFNGNNIGKITTGGALTEYPIPTAGSTPSGITAGPDGNIWFTELIGNKIGVINLFGMITAYTIPTANSQPAFITLGPDGNLWFTESSGNKIGVISPNGTFLHEYPVTTANSSPFAIVSGLDGNVWFTETNGNQIGRITPSGVVTEFPISDTNSFPVGITVGP